MREIKITIEQLKNYLGTGLKLLPDAKSAADQNVLIGIYQDPCLSCDCVYFGTIEGQDMRTIQEMKPLFYRLSDLDKFIPELGFVPMKRLLNDNPDQDDSIEIELIEGIMPFQKRFRAITRVEYPDGESRKEYLADFFLNGNHGMVPFSWMEKLFQWHFWPFGDEYFESGLVIDKLLYNLPTH